MPRQFPPAISSGLSKLRRAAGPLLVAIACAACTAGSRGGSELAESAAPVVGGEVSPAGGSEDAVLLMRTVVDEGEIVCTASLVAKNLAITARHCVAHLVAGDFRCTAQGELESDEPGAGSLGMHFDATELAFYGVNTPRTTPVARGAQILSTLSTSICTNDLAFVVLDREVPLPVLPMRQHGRALLGEAVTLVGYGFDDAMAGGNVLDYATQPRTHNQLLTVADLGPAGEEGVSSAPPRIVVVDGPSGCVGDSGGPLLARDTGAVLGIYSLLDGTSCLAPDARNLFTHVPDFAYLAAQAFTAAGATPVPEPAGSTAGEGGGGPAGGGGAENGEGGAVSAGAPNDASASGSGGGGTGGSGTTGPANGEGGAPRTPSDRAGEGGSPATNPTGGTSSNAAGAGAPASPAGTHAKHHAGCAVTPGGARGGAGAWLVALVAVLEGIFGIPARSRRRRGLRARLRRGERGHFRLGGRGGLRRRCRRVLCR